jgi:hypothetical protein
VDETLHFSATPDCLDDFANRFRYIAGRRKVHVVPAMDDDLSAVA